MAGASQQRDQDSNALRVEVAFEEYKRAAGEATAAKTAWEAAEGRASARKVATLKSQYETLKEDKELLKEHYEMLFALEEKRQLQTKLPGAGEQSPLWAYGSATPMFAQVQI